MKRVGNLYLSIADPDNLRRAFLKAARGKRQRREVREYTANLDANLMELHRQLLAHEVVVGDYRFFIVRDPKVRQICAASFRERVLHHAIMNICEPVLEGYAIDDSFACRQGKGLHTALKRAQQFTRCNSWYLKLDIRKYFDSIPHDRLLALLARRFKDRDLLELFARILAAYETEPGRGLPIGNLLSQHFANFYLGALDHWLKEQRQVKGYLRYMDDFVLFAADRETLRTELAAIETFIRDHLGLELKENIQLNRVAHGLPFLGFRLYPHTVRLAPRSRERFARRLVEYETFFAAGSWNEAELACHVGPLVEFTRVASAASFRRQVLTNRRKGAVLQGAPTA
ncbi:RNA-directed DNA polymerase [Desulfuromonas carbonis]|uniref:reverse transcriptase/maturase family protein n=1 Tax=Desulfuromonas sp. DDH964 TaxID=1823759 RepID=UPI00078C59EA|nr:reverse transcriptase/maturase family protein [Desulfuromonas sp. DDH964]AMV71434.1 RNA-directed DNA polymerase and maturase, group II intron origin [Desulfuromonas sp. DDH964]